MALWGSRDSFSLTGTVAFVNTSSTVTGTSTTFLTQLEIGDAIITSGGAKYKVTGIASNTSMTISPAWSTANASGQTITGQDAPKFLAAEGATIQAIDKVYGVDSTEAVAQTTDPGWVYVNTYTDMHGLTRTKREVLVAASSYTGDAEDTVYPDVVITINTQPSNSSEATGNTVEFTVSATTLPTGVSLNYRWQEDTGSGFVNLTNTGVYSDVTTSTLVITDNTGLDGNSYRVQIGATGAAANAVSSSATLTEV